MGKNFFDTTSIACRERVHSAVIGWMLSDGCTALTTGQKLDILCGLFHVKNKPKNVKNIEVRLEWNNIDILIITTSSQGSCCWVVENKLKSSQHDNQLDKYESIINKDFFSYNHHFLLLSAILFAIGLFGLLTKKGLIPLLMCVELMLNAVNINLVAFNHYMPVPDYSGQLMAIFSVAVAASEIAVGVALVFRIYRDRGTVNVDELKEMKG